MVNAASTIAFTLTTALSSPVARPKPVSRHRGRHAPRALSRPVLRCTWAYIIFVLDVDVYMRVSFLSWQEETRFRFHSLPGLKLLSGRKRRGGRYHSQRSSRKRLRSTLALMRRRRGEGPYLRSAVRPCDVGASSSTASGGCCEPHEALGRSGLGPLPCLDPQRFARLAGREESIAVTQPPAQEKAPSRQRGSIQQLTN